MSKLLRKCKDCGSYTMQLKCPKCGSANTVSPHPPKFSLDDKYLRLRMHEKYSDPEKDSSAIPSA